MPIDEGCDPAVHGRRKRVQVGPELGGKEEGGDPGGQAGEEASESSEGQIGVAGAGMDGSQESDDLLGELIGLPDDARSEGLQVIHREGRQVVAMLQGIEVADGSADGTRAESVVVVGAATGEAAHGPGAAAGDLAGSLDRVSWHSPIVPAHLFWCQGVRATDDWRRVLLMTDDR